MGRKGRKRSHDDRQSGADGPGSDHSAGNTPLKVQHCDLTASLQLTRHLSHTHDVGNTLNSDNSGDTHCTGKDTHNTASDDHGTGSAGDTYCTGDNTQDIMRSNDTNTSNSTGSITAKGGQRLDRSFYNVCGEDLAKALLGQKIVRMVDDTRLCARIVETEAYLGAVDKAAHSYKGRTDRNQAMFMQPGTAYVYNIYGMYCCLNISSQGAGCAVLIRSVEPLEGVDKMTELKKERSKSSASKPLKVCHVANGPAKLCQALNICKQNLNMHDLVTDQEIWLERGESVSADDLVVSARINIAYAEDWTDKPLRFYLLHNPCVSVRDKVAEKQLQNLHVAS